MKTALPTQLVPAQLRVGKSSNSLVYAATLALLAASLAATALGANPPNAPAPAAKESDLMSLDLDALSNVKVTSVSKREEKLTDAPAAVAVVTSQDIERSGAKSLPEALRLIPGMQVAQMSASGWQISARGFQGQFSDKMLVLVDGRSVYSPTFSGVYWDMQEMILEDIDRIEVIRGPGATVWGANAVNGVINVVTKSAKDTQGALVTVTGGTSENASVGLRYGSKVNDQLFLRVYGKYDSYDDLDLANGHDADDRWHMARGGFRLDWQPADSVEGMLSADVSDGQERPGTINIRGADVVARLTKTLSATSSVTLQAYYDRIDRDPGELRDTGDLDVQHSFALGERQNFVWGLNYRYSVDDLSKVAGVTFRPPTFSQNLFGAFLQDTIAIVPEKLDLSVGTKVEHNDFTGGEVQPSARLSWRPTETQTIWGAVSRAVRTPNRYDVAVTIGPTFYGNPSFKSEELIAYEAGYRIQPVKELSFDLSGYYNDYENIKGVDFIHATTLNGVKGEGYGFDLSATWQPAGYWRLTPFYSYIHNRFETPPGNLAVIPLDEPQNQVGLRSALDIGKQWQFDLTGRYVGRWQSQNVPSYFTGDVRLAWKATKNLELAVVGQNLLHDRRQETGAPFGAAAEYIPRSVYGKLTLRF